MSELNPLHLDGNDEQGEGKADIHIQPESQVENFSKLSEQVLDVAADEVISLALKATGNQISKLRDDLETLGRRYPLVATIWGIESNHN